MTVATNAYEEIRSDVLAQLERAKLDPRTNLEGVRQVVVDAVEGYQTRAHLGEGRALRDPKEMVARLLTSIIGFGPLTELLTRPDIEEVFIEGSRVSYLDAMGRLQGLAVPTSEAENRQIIDRLLATTQRHLDAQNPIVQARVLDGKARLSAAIPPVADQLSATIRRHILRKESIHSLVERGSLTPAAASFLWATMQTTTSTVVAGPPGAGKTSLLAALVSAVPTNHCIRCCEEIRELSIPITHGSYYEARPPALDGSGEIPLRDLVKLILAMRPDRIVVGEVRGAEAFELTRAVNAGCGFACTVHANSAREAMNALVNTAIMAGENITEHIVRKVFSAAIDFVVYCDRDDINRADPAAGIRRQVMEILAVVPALNGDFSAEPIFLREELGKPLVWTGAVPPSSDLIERALPEGLSLRAILEGRSLPL